MWWKTCDREVLKWIKQCSMILFIYMTTLGLAKGDELPPMSALEGSLSARIDIINDQRPLPNNCRPTDAKIVLVRRNNKGMENIAICSMEAAELECIYPDRRYHGVGKGLPGQLRVTNVSLDMAGDYLATIQCEEHPELSVLIHQMTTTLYVQGFPSVPVITIMEVTAETISLMCESMSRTEPSSFRRNITYNWIVTEKNYSLVNHKSMSYNDVTNITLKSIPGYDLNVTCVAKEIGSDLEKRKVIIIPASIISATSEYTTSMRTTEGVPVKEGYTLYIVTGVLGSVAVLSLCVIMYMFTCKKKSRADSKRRTSKTTVVTITGTPMTSHGTYPSTPRSHSVSMHGDFGHASVDRTMWHTRQRLSNSVDALLHDDFTDVAEGGNFASFSTFSGDKFTERMPASIYECIPDPGNSTQKPLTSPNVVYSKPNNERHKKTNFAVLYKIRSQDDQIDRESNKSVAQHDDDPVGPPVPEHTVLSHQFDDDFVCNNIHH